MHPRASVSIWDIYTTNKVYTKNVSKHADNIYLHLHLSMSGIEIRLELIVSSQSRNQMRSQPQENGFADRHSSVALTLLDRPLRDDSLM